jgi:ABC-2 type transport system permease protein
MKGTVFSEELKRSWLGMLYWGLGMGGLMLFLNAILQNNELIEQMQLALRALPSGILKGLGISDLSLLRTPDGFLTLFGFTYASVILSVYGVMSGLGITANDEDDGSLNVLLSMPLHRWQIIVEKYLAFTVMLLVIVLMMFAGIVIGSNVFNVPLNYSTMLLACLNQIPLAMSVMAITCLIASVFSQKAVVSATAAGVVVVSYFINVLVGSLDKDAMPLAAAIQKLSVFSYVDSEGLAMNGSLNPLNITLLLGLSLVLVIASVYAFERRDIGG